MTARSARMQTIVGLASREEETAARQLADSQLALERVIQQRDDMFRARADYANQLLNQGGARTASEMQGMRVFIQQLDSAIEQLDAQLKIVEKQNQHCLQVWLKLRNKTQALDGIKDRYVQAERRELDNRDQFESDELSQRKN